MALPAKSLKVDHPGASEFGPIGILTNAQTLNCQDSKLCLSP